MTKSFESLVDVISTRRAVYPRFFTGETIGNTIVEKLLENANWAPSHRKTEPWRFHVFTGDAKQDLGQHFQKMYDLHTPREQFRQDKFNKLILKNELSSHVFAICMQRDPKESVPEWEELAAVAMAVQNLWLSVSAADYGSYWSSPALQIEHFDKLVDLQQGEKCLGFFYLGVPKPDLELPAQRKPIGEKVKWY